MLTQDHIENRLKSFLKRINLSEETISTILGALVVLIVGSLIVNYFQQIRRTEQITQEAASTDIADLVVIPTPTPNRPETYTVQHGDHLWEIAQRFYGDGEQWQAIAVANQLVGPDVLTAGQELLLPDVNPAITQGMVLSAKSIEAIKEDRYTVTQGDTLQSIAQRAYGTAEAWTRLVEANNLLTPDHLEVGMELTIPRDSLPN